MNFITKLFRKIEYYKKKLLPEENEKILKWAAMSPRRSSFYYFFFSSKFDREHYSVLNGKLAHYGTDKSLAAHDATLRRNIHRLEKGLINIPLRKVFAQDYISETIASYEAIFGNAKEVETKKWAHDVLVEYFRNVEPTEEIGKARDRFLLLNGKGSHNSLDGQEAVIPALPYQRKESVKSQVTFDQFYKLSKQRRSVRWYSKEKVPMSLVQHALEAASLSPSACNRQPYRFICIDDPEELRIAGFLPMGATTFAHNIPMLAILVGDLTAYFDERDRHIIYIDGGLVAMSFMYALETLGLSSCPINWPDIEEREKRLSNYLKLPPHERCIMFISVGYALEEGKIPFSQKKSIDTLLSKKEK